MTRLLAGNVLIPNATELISERISLSQGDDEELEVDSHRSFATLALS